MRAATVRERLSARRTRRRAGRNTAPGLGSRSSKRSARTCRSADRSEGSRRDTSRRSCTGRRARSARRRRLLCHTTSPCTCRSPARDRTWGPPTSTCPPRRTRARNGASRARRSFPSRSPRWRCTRRIGARTRRIAGGRPRSARRRGRARTCSLKDRSGEIRSDSRRRARSSGCVRYRTARRNCTRRARAPGARRRGRRGHGPRTHRTGADVRAGTIPR